MPSKSWRKSISVINRLKANPKYFGFIQAVRLLERAAIFEKKEQHLETSSNYNRNMGNPVARFSPPTREIVRFKSSQDLKFPTNEVGSIGQKENDSATTQWEMMLNFIGLTGAMGVMPFHYTELVLKRLKTRDRSLSNFVDLFNHRTASLFYQASNKYRLPIEYERTKLFKTNKSEDSPHTQALLSLLGLGTANMRNRSQLRDESLIFYSGLLTQQVKTATGLKQFIQNYFGVPVEIEGFVGQWQTLIEDVRTRLPSKQQKRGQNVCLGKSTMLGKQGWFAQGKSRIKIGPLNKKQYENFAPGSGALTVLNDIVHTYIGIEESYDFVIQVKRNEITNKVALNQKAPPMLAWNTWLSGKPKTNSAKDDYLEIMVSAKASQSL